MQLVQVLLVVLLQCVHAIPVFPPTQWLIVTLALYALLLTINGLSVFLNDWASRGEVERIGLLQSVNAVSGNETLSPTTTVWTVVHAFMFLLPPHTRIINCIYTMHTHSGWNSGTDWNYSL